jgi:hypothetical protein
MIAFHVLCIAGSSYVLEETIQCLEVRTDAI